MSLHCQLHHLHGGIELCGSKLFSAASISNSFFHISQMKMFTMRFISFSKEAISFSAPLTALHISLRYRKFIHKLKMQTRLSVKLTNGMLFADRLVHMRRLSVRFGSLHGHVMTALNVHVKTILKAGFL